MARRVIKKIEHLAAHPESLPQPLRNLPSDLAGLHKFCVGDYRVLFWLDSPGQTITLYVAADRSTVYRSL